MISPRRVAAISKKEALFILRDPRSLGVALLLPVVLLLLFGYAINYDVKHIALAVYDADRTPESRDLVEALTRTEYFRLVGQLGALDEADEVLAEGVAKVVLVIPPRFARDLAASRPTRVQSVINGSDSLTATVSLGYLDGMIREWALRRLQRRLPQGMVVPLQVSTRVWFNEDLSSVIFITPGLVVVILMVVAALLTSQTIVREREQGTMELLIVSPFSAREILVGKLLPYIAIALADVLLVAIVGRLVFQVPMRGSFPLVFALLLVYLLAALGIGLLISVSTRSQQAAYIISLIGTLLPTMLLTGFVFPVSGMPRVLRAVVQLHPATQFMVIVRAVSLRAAGLPALWPHAAALAALAAAILGLAVAKFRKTL